MPDIKAILETRKRALDEAEERLNELSSEINSVKSENESVIAEKENILRKIEMKKSELGRKETHLNELRNKIQKAKCEQETLEQSKNQKVDDEIEFDSVNTEYSDVVEQIRNKESSIDTNEMRITKLNNDINVIKPKLAQIQKKCEEITASLDDLKRQTEGGDNGEEFNEDEVLNTRRELETRIREIDVENDDISRKINLKNSQLAQLEKTLKASESQIEKLITEKKALEEELGG